jgi:hypothetical protein
MRKESRNFADALADELGQMSTPDRVVTYLLPRRCSSDVIMSTGSSTSRLSSAGPLLASTYPSGYRAGDVA